MSLQSEYLICKFRQQQTKCSPLSPSALPSVSAVSDDVIAEAMASLTKLVRNRRNVPVLAVPQFKRLPDFWGWYKYFMEIGRAHV